MVIRNSHPSSERGAALVESTLVLVFLLTAAIGATEYTRLVRYYRNVSFLSREAASASFSDCGAFTDPRACLANAALRFRDAGVQMLGQDVSVILSVYSCQRTGAIPCAPSDVVQLGACRAYRTGGTDGSDTCVNGTAGANPSPYNASKYSTPTFRIAPYFTEVQAQQKFTIAEVVSPYRSSVSNLFGIFAPLNGRSIHEATIF